MLKMQELNVEQSVKAVFGLCSDVSRLTVHGVPYFYFNAKNPGDVHIIRYIFRKNNVAAQLHRTHYYNGFGGTTKIVRVHPYDLNDNPEFKRVFEYVYNRKEEFFCSCLPDRSGTNLFALWSRANKLKLIQNIAENVK